MGGKGGVRLLKACSRRGGAVFLLSLGGRGKGTPSVYACFAGAVHLSFNETNRKSGTGHLGSESGQFLIKLYYKST